MSLLLPLARTPMDKESARGMERYHKDVSRTIDGLAPWEMHSRRGRLRDKVKSGTVVVIPDATDNLNDPLYQGAQIVTR